MFKKYIEYLKDNPEGYWFKRKCFGWGWVPATREGWLVTLAYIGLIIAFAFTIDEASPRREVAFTFLLPVLFLTVSFILIAYKTGEKPKWEWGCPSKKKDKNPASTKMMADKEEKK